MKLLHCLLLSAALCSCVNDAENAYSNIPAYFNFRPVNAPSSLFPAIGNPGEWCYVTIQGANLQFESVTTGRTDRYPLIETGQASSQYRWVSGLLIGTPTSPTLNGTLSPVCYDLVCPSCYEEGGIRRSITVTEAGQSRAACSRCHRVYGLSDSESGAVVEGRQGNSNPRLYRYRIQQATSDQLIVRN